MILARYFIYIYYTCINRIFHITAASPGHPAEAHFGIETIFFCLLYIYIDNALYKSICELYFIILRGRMLRLFRFNLSLNNIILPFKPLYFCFKFRLVLIFGLIVIIKISNMYLWFVSLEYVFISKLVFYYTAIQIFFMEISLFHIYFLKIMFAFSKRRCVWIQTRMSKVLCKIFY